MLRITITDTKTNEVLMETFGKCICAGITEDDTETRAFSISQSDGVTRTDAGICLEALDNVRKNLLKLPGVRISYLTAKLFSRKEKRVIK